MSLTCFHCGLPVSDGNAFPIVYRQTEHVTCCAGCQAVAQSIIDAGLDFYYEQRTADADKAALPDAEILAQLRLYDLPEVQQSFVYEQNGGKQATLLLGGITCAACVWLIEQTLLRLNGVTGVSINYSNHRLHVSWQPQTVALSDILLCIQNIGYQAEPYDRQQQDERESKQRKQALVRLWVAGLSMMQVMMFAVPTYLYGGTDDIEPVYLWLMHWASMVLTLPVVVYSAVPFYRGALRDAKNRRVGMDTPVSLAVLLAFGASLYALLTRTEHGIYFDSISMFVFLLLGGRYLEQIARRKASDAVERLSKIVPAFCHVLPDYPQTTVQEGLVAQLQRGNVVLVRAGEVLPVDGTVVDGSSEIDQAMLTGESVPVPKNIGDSVEAGTVNLSSPLCIQTREAGQYTRLSGIVRLLDSAMAKKPRVAQLADRYASWFVAALLVFAVATFAWWTWHADAETALWIVVALLVITCPCALSLATPTALAAASGFLAGKGLLISRAHSLETLARVSDVVFDKTGTLTCGSFSISQTWTANGCDEHDMRQIAAALEQHSEHLLARAFVLESAGLLPLVEAVHNQPGLGLSGVINGTRWRIGRPNWVAAATAEPTGWTMPRTNTVGTWIALGNDCQITAAFCLADRIKDDSAATVAQIQQQGKTVHLLSGDATAVVNNVADALHIEHRTAAATPESKLAYVRALQQQGKTVLMVGDGINDAPVLVQADVSVAVDGGADVAQAGSDMVMIQPDMGLVAVALRHSRKTRRIMQENFAWAGAYNLIAVPLAAIGAVNPWLAALGMALSSLLVTANALRLLRP